LLGIVVVFGFFSESQGVQHAVPSVHLLLQPVQLPQHRLVRDDPLLGLLDNDVNSVEKPLQNCRLFSASSTGAAAVRLEHLSIKKDTALLVRSLKIAEKMIIAIPKYLLTSHQDVYGSK
jgi:hypothetical protein